MLWASLGRLCDVAASLGRPGIRNPKLGLDLPKFGSTWKHLAGMAGNGW